MAVCFQREEGGFRYRNQASEGSPLNWMSLVAEWSCSLHLIVGGCVGAMDVGTGDGEHFVLGALSSIEGCRA